MSPDQLSFDGMALADVYSPEILRAKKAEAMPDNTAINLVTKAVAQYYEIDPDSIYEATKKETMVLARCAALYILYTTTEITVGDLGADFNLSRTNVTRGVNRIKGMAADNCDKVAVTRICAQLRQDHPGLFFEEAKRRSPPKK